MLDILLGPDVFVNASVALGSPPEQVARRVLGKPGSKPKTTKWVLSWIKALLDKTPGFKHEAVTAQMKTIEGLLEVVEVLQEQQPRGLLGIVELRGATRLFPEDVVDVLEGLFEHLGHPCGAELVANLPRPEEPLYLTA